ncbi:MAG: RluA family pseudouridine synthase [Bryobacteraceae bacterium]
MTLVAGPLDTGKRLDAFLHERLPEFSRSRLQSWIKASLVSVNGKPARPSDLIKGTERISVTPAAPAPLRAIPEELPLTILYEDQDVIIVDKPAGMVVHAGAGHHEGTLVNALLHHFGTLSSVNGDLRPGIVHRLDKETSGVLAVARTDFAHQALAAQFQSRQVEKVYLAVVHGRMKAQGGTITTPITRDPIRRTRMMTKLGSGRSAYTEYQVLEQFPLGAFLRVRIGTGRTHQIRVHLASIGHPILGDRLYGAPARVPGSPPLARFFLHAHRLRFLSPGTGQPITVESPLPEDLTAVLASLRRGQIE